MELVNKVRLKKAVQTCLLALGNFLMAIGMAVWVAHEPWPLWKKAIFGSVIGIVLVLLIATGVWLVYF